jgi:F0F1-type ATP synthase assembly protein I
LSRQQDFNQTAILAGIVGQIGCITVLLIGLALGAGVLLDRFLETRPIFTILFIVGSVPVNLYVTVRISLAAAARAERLAREAKTREAEGKNTK